VKLSNGIGWLDRFGLWHQGNSRGRIAARKERSD